MIRFIFRISLILSISSFSNCFGQVSTSDFLSTALYDISIAGYQSQFDYLKKPNYRISFIKKLEVRTQNDEFDPEEQEYGLRFNPTNPYEIKYNNQLFESYQRELSIKKAIELKEVFKEKYILIINFTFQNESLRILEEEILLLEGKIKAYEKLQNSRFFDAESYIKAKLSLIEKIISKEEIHLKIEELELEILDQEVFQNNVNIGWTSSDLISMKQIDSLVNITDFTSLNHSLLALKSQKIIIAENEAMLEKSKRNIGFIQGRYFSDRVNKTPFGIGIGIALPITNPQKGDYAEKKLEEMEAKVDLNKTKETLNLNQLKALKALKSDLNQLKNLQRNIDEFNFPQFSKALSQLNQADPIVNILLKEGQLKFKQMQHKLIQKVFLSYLELLDKTDMMIQAPYINYLSPNLEQLN